MKKKKKQKQELYDSTYVDQDDYFYYIAGYTPGGAPYGITWEEAYREGLVEEDNEQDIEVFK